jgi:hypothetical protein
VNGWSLSIGMSSGNRSPSISSRRKSFVLDIDQGSGESNSPTSTALAAKIAWCTYRPLTPTRRPRVTSEPWVSAASTNRASASRPR